MIKKSRFSVYITLSFLIFAIVSSANTHSYSTNNKGESASYNSTANTLFAQDPTNPTQVLRYRLLAENPDLLNKDQIVKKETLQDVFQEEQLDEVRSFYIIDSFLVAPYNYVQKSATLLAKGTNSYVYVLNEVISSVGISSARNKAELWRDQFENKIYPNDVLYFGSPDGTLGDIDGDPHVTILLANLDGNVAGYFDMRNEINTYNSNRREMVYVHYSATYGVLAHEFQHLIHYNYDVNERWWVDEGCAEYAKYLSGYDVTDNLTDFARDYFAHYPDDSLLYWNYQSEGGRDVRIDYGTAYMFIFYLAEKYGFIAIEHLVASTSVGATGVEAALSSIGETIGFNDLFLNWAIALYVDDTSFGDGLFGYDNLDISMDYDLVTTYPINKNDRLNRFYGIYTAKLNSPLDKLMLSTNSVGGKYLGLAIAFHDLNGWTVEKTIQTGNIAELINGTIIDDAYLITSIMDSSTPYVSSDDQFTVGVGYYVDYSLAAGKLLTVDSYSFNYESNNWNFSLNHVIILDENETELNDTSGILVYTQFRYEGSSVVYESLPMNYSISLDWFLEMSLQYFDEDIYDVYVIATSPSQYGRDLIDVANVAHLLIVEKPDVSLNVDSTGLYVTVNASYTQLNGWEKFTENAQTMILIYDKNGIPQGSSSISYNAGTNQWGVTFVDLSQYNGEYYIKVSFRYADRTVKSPESDHFIAKGELPSSTGFLDFTSWYIVLLGLFALSIQPIVKRLKK